MRLLIAAGGTGGHIYPALAVASALRRRSNPPDLAWLGGHRGLESTLVPDAGLPLRRLLLRSLRSVEVDVHLVLDPLRLAVSVPQALGLLLARRPAAIFTTGGYVAIPVLVAARLLGVPSLLWEGNVVPGKSVRATASLATALAVSFARTCAALATGRPCFETGTPIRDVGALDRLAARERLGLHGRERLVVIFGGSQAVRRFNTAVAEALPELAERAVVMHVTGQEGHHAAQESRDRLPAELRSRYRPQPFLGEGLLEALAAADLVVGRAGSSTLAEATALGLPIVVVPYPHAGAHQALNAEVVAEAGAARLIPDAELDGAALLAATTILERPTDHATMAAASRSLGRPGAAAAVAELLMALAERRALPAPDVIEARARAAA
jgi:UDP-N-acetylglucosamine--N-acetylmuramyl-(pentapeptide) pyrophosphoryl-undecaprenol N-acetylglucosamine transferase